MSHDCLSSLEKPRRVNDLISHEAKEEEDEEENHCPLFMEGLPKDFDSNPALAAIANLLDDELKDDEKKKSPARYTVSLEGGGGKVSNRNRVLPRSMNRTKPYDIPKKTKASLGEAQLFLKMWKI